MHFPKAFHNQESHIRSVPRERACSFKTVIEMRVGPSVALYRQSHQTPAGLKHSENETNRDEIRAKKYSMDVPDF